MTERVETGPPLPARASAPRKILASVTALTGGEVLARLVVFAATALLARRLGPDGFGVVGFATAFCGYFALAVNSGIHDVASREVARAPGKAVDVYSSVATVRLLLAAAAFALLAVVAWLLPKPPETRLVVLLTGLTFFSFSLDPSWVFRGLERPVLAAFGLVLAQSLYALGVVLAVRGPHDVVRVPALQFAGELAGALVLAAVLLRGARPRLALRDGLGVLGTSGYLGLARVLRTVVITFDVVLLGFLDTERHVGLYTAAYRLTFLLMSVISSISAAYLPSYARVTTGGAADVRRLLEASLRTAVSIGAPLVVGTVVVARPLLILLFGPEYEGGAATLQLLALSVGVVFLYWCVSNLLIVTHRTRLYAAIHGVSALVNVALNLVLIPRYGIAGAAAATLAAEASVLAPGVLVLRRLGIFPSLRGLLAPAGAVVAMAGAVLLAGPGRHVVVQVAIGAVAYLCVLATLGGVPTGLWRR